MIALDRLHKLHAKIPLPDKLCAYDPGETTGWCYFEGLELKACGQLNTSDLVRGALTITANLQVYQPSVVVLEDYRVYANKLEQHRNADLFTPRLIGAVEVAVASMQLPYRKQMAFEAKGFITDEKLKAWGMWIKGQRHARDAIRHALYYIICAKVPAGNVITYRS